MNPVLIALDKELARFKNSVENGVVDKEIRTYVNKLCVLWNSYEGRIKEGVYAEKILELGDFLFSLKHYRLASSHCYGRYLYSKFVHFFDVITNTDVNSLLETFFPDVNNHLEVVNTIRALIGYSSSASFSLIQQDALFQNADTPREVVNLLKLMQLAMQMGLKKDIYCWLVYNGTNHLYTISRIFMTRGFSKHILKYLIWSCVCMESSVPLMTVKYFSWRSQLYAITCQCYYDLKADAEAEKFARRGLQKVEELREIESMSSSLATPESVFMFNQAAIKLNIMVFKRQVFEIKRRPKGVLRSKIKPVLKDMLHNQWPRTSTERLLAETFRSRASQFLAVIEALTNSNRRLVQSSLGAPDNDDRLEAYLELFFAGVELLAGGGGAKPPVPGKQDLAIADVANGISLINLASSESHSISLESVILFLKSSYNYESWETFDLLRLPVLEQLRKYPEDKLCAMELKFLDLLSAISVINPARLRKRLLRNEELESVQLSHKYKPDHIEYLLNAAIMLNNYVMDKNSKVFITRYCDALVDIVFIFWNKCRKYFARFTSSSLESSKYHDSLFLKWLKVLVITQKLMITLHLNDIDICACAEASLKLSMVLECIAQHGTVMRETSTLLTDGMAGSIFDRSVKSSPDIEVQDLQMIEYLKDISAFLEVTEKPIHLLEFVQEMLTSALNSMISARDNMLKPHTQIADDSFKSTSDDHIEDMYTLNMQAYHVEVMYQYYHIISLISSIKSSEIEVIIHGRKKGQQQKRNPQKSSHDPTKDVGLPMTGKNDLLKALYLLSLVEINEKLKSKENTQQLEEAYMYIQKSIQVESKIRHDNTMKKEVNNAVPPPPLLVNRGSSWMVFKPAPFIPKGGETIRWYCLYLRNSAGNNVKVRLNDTKYKGSGEEIPYNHNCTFTVKGLEPNERYVAAVAAYDKHVHLIGGSIGDSGRPFLAAHLLPCLLVYGKLCKVAFNKNVWKLSKMAYQILWEHYVEIDIEETSNIKSAKKIHQLHPYRLKIKNVENSSSVMLRYFIECVFISVDISIKEGALFCDSLCDEGPLTNGQISRLNECEKLLIAIEICGWLNDNILCLQAVVMTYGLLAPIIHWKVPIIAVLNVLLCILSSLQEIQSTFKNKKQNSTTESLRHMVSCLAYYVANILVYINKKPEAVEVLENSIKLLVQMNAPESYKTKPNTAGPDDDTNSLSGKKNKKVKPRVKTKVGVLKSLSEISPGNLLEIRALEIYTLKLIREVSTECNNELTGNEDVVMMNAVVSSLPIPLAYKEVVKFKRRAQFFEAFVGILGRALKEASHEYLLEWIKETIGWLTRRNEIILNKTANDPKGAVVVTSNAEAEKLKQYSNAVVEYGHSSDMLTGARVGGSKKSDGIGSSKGSIYGGSIAGSKQFAIGNVGSKQLIPINEEMSETGVSKGHTKAHKNHDDRKTGTILTDEKRIKEGIMKLQGLLTELWKTMQRRRKMRNVCFEELPWRCQMNLISADCHFQMCLNSFEIIAKQHGCPDLKKRQSMMDLSWFTLSTSGAMIVSWAGCMKTCINSMEKTVDIGGVTIDHKPEIHIVPSVSKQTINLKVEKKQSCTTKTSSSHRSEEHRKEDAIKHFLHHLQETYLHYQRAIVLSHRGCNWVLLQQTCNKLYNTTYMLIMNIMTLNINIDTTTYKVPYELSELRTSIYKSFCMAAEFLIECMSDIENQWIPESKIETYGNIHQNKGGCSLTYDYLDCNSYIDYANVRRVVMFAIELLFYEQKWEMVISIIMKLNALSLEHFSESLLPLLVVSQKYLSERLTKNESALNFHPSIIFDQNTGIPLDINLVPIPPEPIEIGAHIDPIGHNLYNIPLSGSKYSIVPIEYESTRAKLKHIIDGRPLMARMLEHSRKLCLAYLAGKQGNKHIDGKLQRVDSAVSFVAIQVKPPLAIPIDYTIEPIELIEDVETHPLSNNLLSVVITSYENTIEVLNNKQDVELAAQAMHELGNIMFHCHNVKEAYKWWSCALDAILRLSNGLKVWRSLIDLENNTLNAYKALLDKCGVWGCLLGGLLAVKVARYIHCVHIDMCCDVCQLAAAFFKALFCASLVHPSSYHSYMDYNIGVNKSIATIIPGTNLFSDNNRIHCSNLTDCAIWLAKHLIKFGFYLEAQPILTFTQYLATTICQDVSSIIEVKLLRVESLCHLNMFACAIEYFSQIISGSEIFGISDSMKLKIKLKLKKFDDSLSLWDETNVKIVNKLCTATLKDIHSNIYGSCLCNKIVYAQANILVSMASVIYEIPIIYEHFNRDFGTSGKPITEVVTRTKQKASQSQKINVEEKCGEKPGEEVIKTSGKQKSASMDIIKMDISVCPRTLKGRLLQFAEYIIEEKSKSITQDLGMYVKYHMLLSKIEYEKLLVVSAVYHINTCLQAITEMKIPDDVDKMENDEIILKDVQLTGENDSELIGKQIKVSSEVDVYIWLLCRQLLCFYLLNDDITRERLVASPHTFIHQVGSVEDNINDAITECDMFNDQATHFNFQMMLIDIDVKNGKNTTDVLRNLKNLENKIILMPDKSYHTKRLLFDLKKLAADLKALKVADVNKSIVDYEEVECAILQELNFHGYDINMVTKFPAIEQMNVNTAVLEDLICTKDCLHRSSALTTVQSTEKWKRILVEVKSLLDVMEKVTMKLPLIKIDLLLLKGQIQRHLVQSDNCEVNVCVKTFLEVIKLSNFFTCDFNTIRKCYLEISMLLFSKQKLKDDELNKLKGNGDNVSPTPEISLKRRKSSNPIKNNRKVPFSEKVALREIKRLGKGIWISIRAASIIAKAQQKSELLAGEVSMTSDPIVDQQREAIPLFAMEDILGMTNAEQTNLPCTLDGNTSNKLLEITWAILLNYGTYLRRKCNYSSLVIGENKIPIVHIPRKCHFHALKLSMTCKYLQSNSAAYQQHCQSILPMESILSILKPIQSATRSEANIAMEESGKVVLSVGELSTSCSAPGIIQGPNDCNIESKPIGSPKPTSPKSVSPKSVSPKSSRPNTSQEKTEHKSFNLVNPEKAKEFEIAVQWYLPELDSPVDHKIHLLAALNNKNVVAKSPSAQFSQSTYVRHFHIDVKEVFELHESMLHLIEAEEAALALKGQQSHSITSLSPIQSPTKSSSRRAKVASPLKSVSSSKISPTKSSLKCEKEDELKKKLSVIATVLTPLLLGNTCVDDDKVVIPFEVNWGNIVSLASWLNPRFGHITQTSETLFNWMLEIFGITNNM